ncbi:MAG TPA: ABC transporter substrate-binding protein [Alphaproteobacteria bacterium]
MAAFLALAAGFWSTGLFAQSRTYRVGILFPVGNSASFGRLVEALAQRGYVEGRNMTYDIRAAGDEPERLPQLARELVARRPDVIVSATEPAARALAAATRDIPIVLALIGDPIALGITQSIARPTRNITGFTVGHDTLAAKRLELMRELVPTAQKALLLWVPGNNQNRLIFERMRQASTGLKFELVSLPVTNAGEITAAMAKAGKERSAVLIVAADPLTIRNRQTIIDECLLLNLPAMHSYSIEVRDGALISYGGEVGEDYSRAAPYVDRILKGAKVAELPFQEPTNIRLSINQRTALSMGLTVPQSIILRADEVIE